MMPSFNDLLSRPSLEQLRDYIEKESLLIINSFYYLHTLLRMQMLGRIIGTSGTLKEGNR